MLSWWVRGDTDSEKARVRYDKMMRNCPDQEHTLVDSTNKQQYKSKKEKTGLPTYKSKHFKEPVGGVFI